MNFPMETKIVGLVKNIEENNYIFAEERNYIVPEYQREYSWKEPQIESFIASIKRLYGHRSVCL